MGSVRTVFTSSRMPSLCSDLVLKRKVDYEDCARSYVRAGVFKAWSCAVSQALLCRCHDLKRCKGQQFPLIDACAQASTAGHLNADCTSAGEHKLDK